MSRTWQDKILMVIPSINGGHLLRRLLPSLRFHPSNVIVLDQGSTDTTATVCADAGVELVQLGYPHTYTEACNIGAQIARDRESKYLCVANNDIVFRTDVLAELFAEMERDPKLGIIAPSQIIIEEALNRQSPAWRVFWNLQTVDFVHDLQPIDPAIARLESDFCELTLALVRMSAIAEIGFLDNDYGFYHEDADFGFRLRKGGYSCAYLPRSQIEHFSSSTFSQEKLGIKGSYVAKNKIRFAKKHLGYGVRHEFSDTLLDSDQGSLNRGVHPYLSRYGLIKSHAPELVVAYPGAESSGYLFTTFEASCLPEHWAEYGQRYRAIFTTSARMQRAMGELKIANSFYVPFGVEPDIFHPWGPTRRFYDEVTYLAIIDGHHEWLLRLILKSWHRFGGPSKPARLILLGRSLRKLLGSPDTTYRWGAVDIVHFEDEHMDVHEILSPMNDHDLAHLYRAVDYAILDRAQERWWGNALQSMACGLPCIFGGLSPAADILSSDLLAPGGYPIDIVKQPEQAISGLAAQLDQSLHLGKHDRAELANGALYFVRNEHTFRHTVMSLYGALVCLQAPNFAEIVSVLERRTDSIIRDVMKTKKATTGSSGATHRLGSFAARRLTTMGNLAANFGSVWQEKGFNAARNSIATELGYFVDNRFGKILRLDGRLFGARAVERITRQFTRHVVPKSRATLLIGYIEAQLGLGQSLRGLALAMSRSTAQFSIYPVTVGVEGRGSTAYMPERYDVTHPHAVNVVEVTLDELPNVYRSVGRNHFKYSYNVLRTYWELSKAPEVWRNPLGLIDEIWAPNAFVAESFQAIFNGPITIVPPCVEPAVPEPGGRRLFGINERRFYFLFSFDYFSFPQRKNPLAVVRAFRAAFPDLSTPVGLIIKTSGSVKHHSEMREQLRGVTRYDGRVEIIDESLSREKMLALMAAADCYVSMHRAEGFGFGMAEAMVLGKPVIGTDYSGNTEFLSEKTGYPVAYVLKDVAPDEYVHTEGQVWADPDEDACAAAMRQVFTNRGEAISRAKAGQQFVSERYCTAAVGNIVERRLNEIFDRVSDNRDRRRRKALRVLS